MIVATLALMLACGDTTMRFVSIDSDTIPAPGTVVSESLHRADTALTTMRADTTLTTTRADTALTTTRADTVGIAPRLVWPVADTVVKKKRAALVEYSDWYGRRLAVHRTLSWAMIPLFAVSYYTGERLARDGRINSPYAVRALHPYAATGAAVVFGVNTVTGVWNLWAGRHDAEGRTRRFAHSILFMIADAGFAYAGSIGKESREDSKLRSTHRTVALSSMGVSYIGMMLMLLGGK